MKDQAPKRRAINLNQCALDVPNVDAQIVGDFDTLAIYGNGVLVMAAHFHGPPLILEQRVAFPQPIFRSLNNCFSLVRL